LENDHLLGRWWRGADADDGYTIFKMILNHA
jgi:hypothetical protein